MSDTEFDSLFTRDKPVIFNYHGYPWLIHRLTYRRANHENFHVRGYKEEGTTTTPFDMCVRNDIDRFHLVIDVIDRVPSLGPTAASLRQRMLDRRIEHRRYIVQRGTDLPEVTDWTWTPLTCGCWSSTPGRARLKLAVLGAGRRGRGRRAGGTMGRRGRSRTPAEFLDRCRRDRRRRPPGRARRAAYSAAGAGRRRASWRTLSVGRGPRSAAQPARRSPRSRRVRQLLPDVPAVACFDTTFHATDPAGGSDLRAAPASGTPVAASPLRLPRAVPRVRGGAGRRAGRPTARVAPAGDLPPGRRLVAVRGPRRPKRRHHDGVHAAGGAGDGDP